MLSPSFSFATRSTLIEKLQRETFDVLIIGGGITGAAVARDAAYRGLKVALIESEDFASGTSSGSSKLIHGGLRYLEQFEFKLVFEAIREREKLKTLYAPFVQDLSFVFPTYREVHPPRWKLNIGLFLYDSFSKFRAPHLNFTSDQTRQKFPWLKTEKLTGSCLYTDSFSEDFRLVIELIKSAHRKSAVCVSRLSLENIQPENSIYKMRVKDGLASKSFEVKAKCVFNCTGPFTDRVRSLLNLPSALRLTQGVHFAIPHERLPIKTAFVLSDPNLQRILFAIPWNSVTYLGTTDTEIEDPTKARATSADAAYVLKIANHYFNVNLTRSDITQSWAAVRPLLKPGDLRNPSKISREHHCEENPKNIFHVMGGKLTSHRLMAKEALDRIHGAESPVTTTPLQDEFWTRENPTRLEKSFGRFSSDVLEIDRERGLNQKLLVSKIPTILSEVLYAIHHEMALTPLDFMRRRSSLYYESADKETARAVTEIFAKEMNWNSETSEREMSAIEKQFQWDKEGY